jgi:hypothetical protein
MTPNIETPKQVFKTLSAFPPKCTASLAGAAWKAGFLFSI